MARRKVVRISMGYLGWPGVWEGIDQLLAAANAGTDVDGISLNWYLEGIGAGVRGWSGGSMPWDTNTAFNNLAALVHAGCVWLRHCPECTYWFIAKKKTQHTCRQVECQTAYKKAEARRRAAKSRCIEHEHQRRARVAVSQKTVHRGTR